MPESTRVPVTVLTGFLGSGKTTLLNRILTEQHGKRIAVIENEFGEIGIDNELVVNAEEEIFEMNNGCICCTVRGDLIRILGNLMKRKNKFDAIIIETTGLADPAPVAQTFFVDDEMKESFSLDAIVTVVDAKHVSQHINTSSECKEQIAFADVLLLNKIDLVQPAELDALEARVHSMNATCKIVRTQNANVPIDQVLDVRAFDLDAKLEINADFLTEEVPFEWGGIFQLEAGSHTIKCVAGPDPTMDLIISPLASPADYDAARKAAIVDFGGASHEVAVGGPVPANGKVGTLVFAKNGGEFILHIANDGAFAVFTQHHPSEFDLEIVHGNETLKPVESHEYAHSHSHDQSVTSVGIVEPKPVDPRKLNAWLSDLLRLKGADIFRMKGIIHIKGIESRFIFQGVHMLFDGKQDRPWNTAEDRRSQMIFIGRNLDRAELEDGFRSCLA